MVFLAGKDKMCGVGATRHEPTTGETKPVMPKIYQQNAHANHRIFFYFTLCYGVYSIPNF